jgi:hypothetical protein
VSGEKRGKGKKRKKKPEELRLDWHRSGGIKGKKGGKGGGKKT